MWQVIDRYPRKGFAIRRVTTGEIADIFLQRSRAEQRCEYLNQPYVYKEDTNERNNQKQQDVAP